MSLESGESPPIIGGNVGGNRAISEYMSHILEPVAKSMDGMEINSSGGLLSVIENINDDLKTRKASNHEEENNPPPSQEDGNLPSTGGPCHQYGGGVAPLSNKYPGTWPLQPTKPT